MKKLVLKQLAFWFPLILPFYLLRFKIGPLPTTALELAFFGFIIAATIQDKEIWKKGWNKIANWRWPIAAWVIATLIAVVVAPNHIAGLGLWRAYILEPLVFFVLLMTYLETEDDRWEIVKAFVTVTVGICAWSIFQFVTNIGIPHPWGTDALATRRATGPFPFPNAVALWCAPVVALCTSLFVRSFSHERKNTKTILFVGITAGIIATLLAQSMGGMIAILTCAVIAGLIGRVTRVWTIIACIIGITIAVTIPPIRTALVQEIGFQDWSGKVRLIIWRESMAMLKDRPIFGAGFGAYPEVVKPYHRATAIEIFQFPHNILLNLWSETGLLGIAAFVWICITWVRVSLHKDSTAYRLLPIGYLLPLIAILIHGLVDVPYFKNDLAFAFWILAALATSQLKTTGVDAQK